MIVVPARKASETGRTPGVSEQPGPDVILIRHGETVWSRDGRHTGRTDIDLTATGEREAEALAPVLAPFRFGLVLCSPRRRAQRTAELAGLPDPVVDDDLQEWDYGDLEGMTTPDIRQRWPQWTIWDGPWPGGESAEDVARRADRVVARCRAQPADSAVALVAHGHILRVVGARWLGGAVAVGRWLALGTAAVCRLGWEHDSPTLQLWNATPAAPDASILGHH